MNTDSVGVVDSDLKFHDYDHVYACDLSIFPTSPAAKPTLTLTALSLRLAGSCALCSALLIRRLGTP